MYNKHIKGAQPQSHQGISNNKITEGFNFTPTILAKLQNLTLQVLFRIWSKKAEQVLVGHGEWEFSYTANNV